MLEENASILCTNLHRSTSTYFSIQTKITGITIEKRIEPGTKIPSRHLDGFLCLLYFKAIGADFSSFGMIIFQQPVYAFVIFNVRLGVAKVSGSLGIV